MPLNETLNLDISSAQRQIAALNRQLDQLSQPIDVPVSVTGEQSLENVTRDLTRSEGAVEELNRELNQTDDALRSAGTAARRTGDDIDTVGRKGATAFGSLNTAVGKLGLAFGAAAVGTGFVRFAGDAIEAASDLEESIGKSTIVFGTFNDEIQDFAATAPQALGLSTQAAIEFTATFGNLFVALGLSQQAAAELSPEIVQLGADLAAFNNIDTGEVLEKLRAGLVGEAEPLRVLGVNLTAATTEAKALELGLGGVTGELTEAEKVQARYALILEQTGTAQGNFAATAEGLAGTQKTLTAEWQNAQAVIGQALVPAIQAAIPFLSDMARAAGEAGIRLGIALGSIEQAAGQLQIFALQSGQAAGSATLLAGAVVELENNLAAAANKSDDLGLSTSELEGEIVDLVNAWGGNSAETQTLIDNLDMLINEFGLSEEAAATLRTELERRRTTAFAEQEDIALLNNLARSTRDVGAAFQETGPLLSGFGADLEQIGELEPIDTSAFDANLASIAAMFDELPNAMDAAGEALRDEENEIVTDFSTFLDELGAQLEAQQAFTSNLGILEALGFSDLADTFRQLGLDSAAALADAVANPEEAARAQSLLEQSARQQAAAFNQAFIAALDPDLSVDVRANLIIDTLGLAGQVRDGGEILVNNQAPTSGGTTIINNFTSPQIPPNDISRTQQVVRAVVGNPR